MLGALRWSDAGEHGPGLRERVDLAFVARGRAERLAVVVVTRGDTSRRPSRRR